MFKIFIKMMLSTQETKRGSSDVMQISRLRLYEKKNSGEHDFA